MTKKVKYRELVFGNTIPIQQIEDSSIEPFRWLAESIQEGKVNLKVNTVDFIVLKILTKKKKIYKLNRLQSFDVYVIGTFRKFFKPTYKVAEAFAEFYLEMNILPNIIAVPKHVLMNNAKQFANKLRDGVLIYERR
ncbi:MAG: hypothetical protein CV087_16780 [Candidatus Brocadia sp. WS118]|nr:MAG: hypothetical protein CV087_16780 [Candidatus Brocadia sp. WS118]